MKKAAAYARVSSDKQSETSIETQLDDIKAFVKTGDIQIVDTFIDKISAAGINRFYIENLQEEIRKKATKVAMKAYFMGGTPPYGFDTQLVRDQEASRNRRVYVINEKEAPVVQLIFEKRAEGLSVHKISKLLNEKKMLDIQNKDRIMKI